MNPDEFYVYKPNLAAGRPAILRKSVGEKAIKMVFARQAGAGESVTTVDVPAAERRRFSITDAEVEELARYALIIERHYGRPMDIEWGRDGVDGKLYILQARPETVKSQQPSARQPATLPARGALQGAGERARDRPEDRAGRGAAGQVVRGNGHASPRATCWSPT